MGPGTYTATQLNDMGWGSANNTPSGSIVNLGGVNYAVYNTADGRRTLTVAQSPSGGSATTNNDTGLRSISLSDAEKKALTTLYDELKTLTPEKFLPEAQSELTPYYERLLKEANYDVTVAKQRLEEDYKKGLRQQGEDVTAQLKQLVGYDFPAEQKKSLEDLNQRGLLGTVLNNLAQPRTVDVNQQTDLGTATAKNVAGEPVNAEYSPNLKTNKLATVSRAPVTTAQFGGLAGRTMGEVTKQQDARQEAILRAFNRYNEDQMIDRKNKLVDYTTQGGRKERDLTQERNEKIGALQAEKFQRALSLNQAKRQALTESVGLKLQGLNY